MIEPITPEIKIRSIPIIPQISTAFAVLFSILAPNMAFEIFIAALYPQKSNELINSRLENRVESRKVDLMRCQALIII